MSLAKFNQMKMAAKTVQRVIENFVDSIVNDTVPPINGEEGMKSLNVVLVRLNHKRKLKRIIVIQVRV